jgi:hypothetical protein
MPKVLKARKHVTSRIVVKEDVENVLKAIDQAFSIGRIDDYHFLNYKVIVLFGAFAGQRPLATIARLIVEQFREAVKMRKLIVDVLPWQDKIRMQHYCPLHPLRYGGVSLHVVALRLHSNQQPLRTLCGAARGRPSGDETGNIVYAIPDIPTRAAENHHRAAENHQSVLVGGDANRAR